MAPAMLGREIQANRAQPSSANVNRNQGMNMSNTQNAGFMSFSSAPLVLGGMGQTPGGSQPVASGFNFMLPLATVAAFNNQAMGFQSQNVQNVGGWLSNIIGQSNAFGQAAYSQNVALNNSAQFDISNYLNQLGQSNQITANASANQAANSGGLFGGGGFLGLGF